MAELFLKCCSGAKNKKLPCIQVQIPTTTHNFFHDFRIGWSFLFFFYQAQLLVIHAMNRISLSLGICLGVWDSHCGAAWREGIVFSHSLLGKAWALHTGDTRSAAEDSLLDACMQQQQWQPQLPIASSFSVVARNLGETCNIIQRISLMRMSSSE